MCTHLRIPGSGSPVVTARSLDFDFVVPNQVCWIPSQTPFPQPGFLKPVPNALHWSTRVPFVGTTVGMSPLHQSLILPWYFDGLNVKGVSFAAQWLPGTTYPKPASSGNLSTLDVGSFVLGNATSAKVNSLRTLFKDVTVVGDGKTPLHFVVADSKENCSVIEFIDGQMQISDVADGVVTNAPEYGWQLKNAYNYENLTPYNNPALYPPKPSPSAQTINGSGMQGLPGDATPPSRYIRAATMVKSVYRPHEAILWPDADVQQNAVTFAAELLRTVMVPRGTAVNAGDSRFPKGDFTQWYAIRDHTNLCFYFASVWNPTLQKIDLREILSVTERRHIPVVQPDWCVDVSSKMMPY